MVTEDVYFQMMKNCSNWNNRNEVERQKRYPIIDAQTGTAQRPSRTAIRTLADRYPASTPTQYCTYISGRWKRKKGSHPSSDAIEMKYIVHCNPAINDVLNQAASAPQTEFPISMESVQSQSDNSQFEKRSSKAAYEGSFDTEVEDPSEEETVEASDEDDWSDGKRKRRRKNAAEAPRRGRRPAVAAASNTSANTSLSLNTHFASSAMQPADPKPFGCQLCAARYKSRAGLNYHCANVHPDAPSPRGTPQHPLMSPNVEVSTFCDICLGDCNENKKTSKSEQLVSCHDCGRSGHPTCLGFKENMIISVKKFGWQCLECKSCAICGYSDNDDQLLFCDDCDRGFHLYCLKPRLTKAPEGEWSCHLCQKEFGSKASLPAGQ